jgi:hypothetical protein
MAPLACFDRREGAPTKPDNILLDFLAVRGTLSPARARRMTDTHSYRLYRFDASGHIVGFKQIDCATDAQAIEQAYKLATDQPQELWSCEKLLAVIQSQIIA